MREQYAELREEFYSGLEDRKCVACVRACVCVCVRAHVMVVGVCATAPACVCQHRLRFTRLARQCCQNAARTLPRVLHKPVKRTLSNAHTLQGCHAAHAAPPPRSPRYLSLADAQSKALVVDWKDPANTPATPNLLGVKVRACVCACAFVCATHAVRVMLCVCATVQRGQCCVLGGG